MGVLNLRLCCFRDKGITSFNENEPSDTTDERIFFFKENKSYGQNFSLGIMLFLTPVILSLLSHCTDFRHLLHDI